MYGVNSDEITPTEVTNNTETKTRMSRFGIHDSPQSFYHFFNFLYEFVNTFYFFSSVLFCLL